MKALGDQAEDVAWDYLKSQRLKLVERNFRSRFGEIDLICLDRSTLIFVEVRMRSSSRFGGAAASVTLAKQKRLIQTAHLYLQANGHRGGCRFDVLLLNGAAPHAVEWIQNAFDAES